jgi:hypothetical protein
VPSVRGRPLPSQLQPCATGSPAGMDDVLKLTSLVGDPGFLIQVEGHRQRHLWKQTYSIRGLSLGGGDRKLRVSGWRESRPAGWLKGGFDGAVLSIHPSAA